MAKQDQKRPKPPETGENPGAGKAKKKPDPNEKVEEIGGRDGPDPTRFGDWENKGRCVDF